MTRKRPAGDIVSRFFYWQNITEVKDMYIEFNSNPVNARVGDCVVRAISKALNKSWQETFVDLFVQALNMYDMPSSNRVWGEYLYKNGWRRFIIPDSCPNCYTIKDFCEDHKQGSYILATGQHVVYVHDGSYFDTWDSGEEIPIYYWRKDEK